MVSALAVDPEAAWAQYAAGDSSMLASIAPGLAVLTPGAGNEDWQALQHWQTALVCWATTKPKHVSYRMASLVLNCKTSY